MPEILTMLLQKDTAILKAKKTLFASLVGTSIDADIFGVQKAIVA